MKKRVFLLIVAGLFIWGLAGCDSLDESVEKASALIPEGYEVLHVQQVSDNSAVVFYTYQDQLSAGFFVKEALNWTWAGSDIGTMVAYPEGLEWRYGDLGNKNEVLYSLYYGKVIQEGISRIVVETPDGEKVQGEIQNLEGINLWYAFMAEPRNPSTDVVITGYSAEEEVLYLFKED